MNALADNAYTKALAGMRRLCPAPRAILCVSAHWMTKGTYVTRMPKPRTIHDFGGFPEALFQVQYPAPGSPEVADLVIDTVGSDTVKADDSEWGLDHGTWSVLRHLFPEAKVPVLQLSLDLAKPPQYHFELGKKLRPLRDEGVFIVGSGDTVHNLRKINWESAAPPFAWAQEFDAWFKGCLEKRDFDSLVHHYRDTEVGKLAVPTPDHYYPALYILGASEEADALKIEYEEIQNGSISMLCFSFGGRYT